MPEERTPPAIPDRSTPHGTPQYAWFTGVVEGGRAGDDGALHAVASQIERLGFGRTDLELDGPRFSLLLTGETVPGGHLDDGTKQSFLEALEALVAAAGDGRPLESTLRCTEVHDTQAVDTLFAIQNGTVRPLSRVRPLEAADRHRAPRLAGPVPEIERLGRRRAIVILAIVFVLGGVAVWQSGWLPRLASADPAEFDILTTEFGEHLAVEVDSSWGSYVIEISRGPTYPGTDEKLAQWQSRVSGARERIAYQAIAAGGTAYVHLLGEDSRRLSTVKVELQPLVVDPRERATVRLPGRPDAHGVAVSPVEAWGR